ncbi:MAG: cytochrome c biogenesis protein [Patescibacteria group bacterium]|nr:cytochrome c biogenesis protein [Patescibacteria group bacterium]
MRYLIFLIVIFFTFLFTSVTNAEDKAPTELYFFYGQGCPHCGAMEGFLEGLEAKYPELIVKKYETYFNTENLDLFEELSSAYGKQIEGVPTSFIDDKVIVGFSNSIGTSLENEVVRCLESGCGSPESKLKVEDPDLQEVLHIVGESDPAPVSQKAVLMQKITIPAILSAAAVDAINPCAFAVLIILLTTVLAGKNRRKALFAGLAFTLSIYLSYLMMGIGLYSAIQVSGATHVIYIVVAFLAIILGLFNLKDYLWYGKWFVMEVPMSWRPKLQAIIKGVTSVPGAFLIGFVVSLFLLPCTSGPYIVILGLLSKTTTRNLAFVYLLLYNFIFVLPMLIITAFIYWGFTSVEQAEEWRKKRLKTLHLIAGIIILLLGIGMFTALALGMV